MVMAEDLTPSLSDTQKIRMNIISLNTRVNEHESDIKKLNEVVMLGEGSSLPLREMVRNHDAIINEWRYWIRFFIGLLIAEGVGFVGAVIVFFVKIYPLLNALANSANKP